MPAIVVDGLERAFGEVLAVQGIDLQIDVVDRPVYGGLNLAGYVDGASPRFGSCYLELRAAASARATFSHGDSVTEPSVVGTADMRLRMSVIGTPSSV